MSGYARYNGWSLDVLDLCIEYTPLAHAVKVLVHVIRIVTLGSSQLLQYQLNQVYLSKV